MDTHGSDQPHSDLPSRLSKPAMRALHEAGIHTLEQLSHHSEPEIKMLHGIGPNALSVLGLALEERGLSFANDRRDNV